MKNVKIGMTSLFLLYLTNVVFISPVSASHTRIVWSQDALQTSSVSLHSTEDTASLCPERVIRGVCDWQIRK